MALVTAMVYHGTARFVGPAWMVGYVLYRRHQGIPLTEIVEREPGSRKAAPEVEYAEVLVPVTGSPISEEMVVLAAKLSEGETNDEDHTFHALYVAEVPRNRPAIAVSPEQSERAQSALDKARRIGEEYGVEVEGYTTGARDVGRAIVEEARRSSVKATTLGAPRKRRLGRWDASTVYHVLDNAPCRALVVEEAKDVKK